MDNCILVSECDSVSLDLFLPELQLAFDSLPDEIIANYVREIAIRFCDRTQIVQQDLVVDFQCGVPDLILEPMCGMQIVSIIRYDTAAACGDYYSFGNGRDRSSCDAGLPRFVPPAILRLPVSPSQDRSGALQIRVGVAPDREACEIPRTLYQRYHETIIAGVKSELYTIKPYVDAALATRFERIFNNGVTAANIDRLTNFHRGPVQMRSRKRIV